MYFSRMLVTLATDSHYANSLNFDQVIVSQPLRVLVGHVLVTSGGTQVCSLHRLLFATINPRAVVTFNYDLIADQTLLDLGRLNWKRTDYSGSTIANVSTGAIKSYYRQLHAGRLPGAIPLLKLHGSIHWERMSRKDGYRLSGIRPPDDLRKTFELSRIPENPFLIPPVASKIEIKQGALRQHWNSAVDYLHDAGSWIIWGYSFPQTDTISQVLFKTALTRNRKPKPVLVVNPDANAAKRVEEVCRKVKIEHHASMEGLLFDWDVLHENTRN